jgi:hypothetical protein
MLTGIDVFGVFFEHIMSIDHFKKNTTFRDRFHYRINIYICIFNLFLTTFEVDIHVSVTHLNDTICSMNKKAGVNESINKKGIDLLVILLLSFLVVVLRFENKS